MTSVFDSDDREAGAAGRGPEAGAGGNGSAACGARAPDTVQPLLLTTVYDPVEAEIIVGKLRSAGIESYNCHDALSVVFGLTIDGFGQQDIFVRAEDLVEAQAALEQEL